MATKLNISELDFENIKSNLKRLLSNQNELFKTKNAKRYGICEKAF